MASTLDMGDLRYLNLFSKITRINTRHFFQYNNILFFCVPKNLISKALGRNAENLKKISGILKKRIRIIAKPFSIKDAKQFIEKIISPITFQNFEIKNNEIIITAGRMNKAALIGRDKRRLLEMQKIVKTFFKMEFKIV